MGRDDEADMDERSPGTLPTDILLRYAAGGALIAYGVVAVVTERSPSLVTPILYTLGLILLGSVRPGSAMGSVWAGIGLCLISTWGQPLLDRALIPLLPRDSFAYIIPSVITYALLVLGSFVLGAALKDGGLFHRSSGVLLVIAAATSLFVGPFVYALVLIWFGYQLIPRKPPAQTDR
jgi:hypothetical protein